MPRSEHGLKIKSNTRVDIREIGCRDWSGWDWLKIVFLVSAIWILQLWYQKRLVSATHDMHEKATQGT